MRFSGLVSCLVVFSVCGAERPAISLSSLRFAGSPVVPVGGWAELTWQIENPKPSVFSGVLRFAPGDRGGDVLDRVVRIPPRSRVTDRFTVPTGAGEDYRVTLLADGQVLSRDQVPIRRTRHIETVLLVGQKPVDIGTGALRPKLHWPCRVRFVRVRARDVPEHWESLLDVRMIGILQPDWSHFSANQVNALKSYVASGGALVFLSPKGALEAAGTPLEELLPATPLALRLIDHPRCFSQWDLPVSNRPDRPLWPGGRTFLESVALGRGLTTLVEDGFPACRWRRFGAGWTGMTAFLPFGSELDRAGFLVPLWRHLLCWSGRPPALACRTAASGGLDRALDLLTGYPTPRVSRVSKVLATYLIAIVLILYLGRRYRHPALGLCGAGAVGVLAAVLIVWSGYRRAGNRPSRSVASLGLRSSTAGHIFYQGVASLFSKSDEKVNIRAVTSGVHFRGFWSGAATQFGVFRTRAALRGLAAVPNLALRALRPRRVCVTSADSVDMKPRQKPLVRIDGTGATVDPARELPSAILRGAGAWVCFGRAEAQALRLGPLATSGAAGLGTGVRLNRLAVEVGQAVAGLKASGVNIVALLPGGSGAGARTYVQFPMDFSRSEWRLELIPASVEIATGLVQIPPELIHVLAASKTTRSRLGLTAPWLETRLLSTQTLAFYAYLPPFVADIRPESITLDLDIANPGENLRVKAFLLPRSRTMPPENNEMPKDAMAPEQTAERHFIWTAVTAKQALDRVSGRLCVLLRCSQKKAISSAEDIQRLNRWRLLAFRVRVSGKLPDSSGPRRL